MNLNRMYHASKYGRGFLSEEQMRNAVPSIFQTKAEEGCSNKYAFLDTQKVVNLFGEAGWLPVEAKQVGSHKRDPLFAKHMIRFAPKDQQMVTEVKVGQLYPEIVHVNSHNRSSSDVTRIGFYRAVCTNKLMVADSSIADYSFRHSRIHIDQVLELIAKALSNFKVVYEKVNDYQHIMLPREEKIKFAEKTIQMFWDGQKYTADQLLVPRRAEDTKDDLFTVFNRIQENIMKGNLKFQTTKGKRHAKEITGIDGDVKINTNLWLLMEAIRRNGGRVA